MVCLFSGDSILLLMSFSAIEDFQMLPECGIVWGNRGWGSKAPLGV